MIADIDKKNNLLKFMNILQLKWMLYNLILNKNYKIIFKKENINYMIIKIFIVH